jgi:hypothetical protein
MRVLTIALLFTSMLGIFTSSVSAACADQATCLHVKTHDCDSNFQRVVCVYWDKTDAACSNNDNSFNNVCLRGDRARKWFQGQQTKRCAVVNNNNLSIEFGLQSDAACTGSSNFQTVHNNNPLDSFTASCTPQGAAAPCRRVRGGAAADGFCVWTVTAPACKVPTTSPTMLPTNNPTNRPTNEPTRSRTKLPTASALIEKPVFTSPPTACRNEYGCTAEMLNNNFCDLKCNVATCNFDNNKCGGYVHVEFTGSWVNHDPAVKQVMVDVVNKLNEIIKPETMDNIPMRNLNHDACTMKTQFPGDPNGPYPNTYKTNKMIIFANLQSLDGSGGLLGQGGTCGFGYREHGNVKTAYTTYGFIRIDEVDATTLLGQGRLYYLILHELCHSMGIGSLWSHYDLIKDRRWNGNVETTTNEPTYKGVRGNAVYAAMGGVGPVPLEQYGGRGTADQHWNDRVFGDELMTGWLTRGVSPISALTLAGLQDVGLTIDMTKADAFTLPSLRSSLVAGDVNESLKERMDLKGDVVTPEQMLVTEPDGTTTLIDTSELQAAHTSSATTETTPGLRPSGA